MVTVVFVYLNIGQMGAHNYIHPGSEGRRIIISNETKHCLKNKQINNK
jgi:hypothetical protein